MSNRQEALQAQAKSMTKAKVIKLLAVLGVQEIVKVGRFEIEATVNGKRGQFDPRDLWVELMLEFKPLYQEAPEVYTEAYLSDEAILWEIANYDMAREWCGAESDNRQSDRLAQLFALFRHTANLNLEVQYSEICECILDDLFPLPRKSAKLPAPVQEEQPAPAPIKQFSIDDLVPTGDHSWLLPNAIQCLEIKRTGTNEYTAMLPASDHAVTWPMPSLKSLLVVMSAYISQPEAQPAPLDPTGIYDQVAYDWQERTYQVIEQALEQERTAKLADLLGDLDWQPAPLEQATFDWLAVPEAPISLSYASATRAGAYNVPEAFRLLPYQAPESLLERVARAGDAFDQWSEDNFALFTHPLVCFMSYAGVIFLLMYTIFNR